MNKFVEYWKRSESGIESIRQGGKAQSKIKEANYSEVSRSNWGALAMYPGITGCQV